MTFSWNTLGKEHPLVRGIPAQFDDAASSFIRISSQTSSLAVDLSEICSGQSEEFAGEAANSFSQIVKEISTQLADVPKVAKNISRIFRHHSVSLAEIHSEAKSALARAYSNWNKKVQAEQDIDSCSHSLSSLHYQISALDTSKDPSVRVAITELSSRIAVVNSQLSQAQNDLFIAEDKLQDSRHEWNSIRRNEDNLNKLTKQQLLELELWSLKDTGNWFTEGVDNYNKWIGKLAEAIGDVWESISAEFLEDIRNFLDQILDALDLIGLVIDFIPYLNAVYKVIELTVVGLKTIVSLALVLKGRMSWAEFGLSFGVDIVGLIPGVPRTLVKYGSKALLKLSGPAGKKLLKNTNQLSSRLSKPIDEFGEYIDYQRKKFSRQYKNYIDRKNMSRRHEQEQIDVLGIYGPKRRQIDIRQKHEIRELDNRFWDDIKKIGDEYDSSLRTLENKYKNNFKNKYRVLDELKESISSPFDWSLYPKKVTGNRVGENVIDFAISKMFDFKTKNKTISTFDDSSRPIKPGSIPLLVPCKFNRDMMANQ